MSCDLGVIYYLLNIYLACEAVSCSRVLSEPVTWDLVGSEGLFSELLVATVLNGIHLESVRVAVDVVVLGEEIRHWVESGDQSKGEAKHDLGVWDLGSGDVSEVLRNVVGHLWGGGWSSIFILDHTVMELWGHSNDHVIVVWVVVSALWHIKTEWWVVVVTGQEVVRVVDETWRVGKGLRKIWWPDSHVGILSLMHRHVWWPHSVMDHSLSVVPLLEEVTSVFLMTWVDLWEVDHLVGKLSLLETLVDEEIVLLMHGSVATLASSLEHLEASSEGGGVISVPGDLRWPVGVTVMHTDGVHLLLVTLDTVWGTNVISEEPGFRSLMTGEQGVSGDG
jgi:hypothetical protein